jgi:hypothetical protein
MAANGISTLTIPTGITATSFTQASSYLVAVGTFNYDAYGAGFAIRKDSGAIDAYMAQVIALGAGARNWTFVPANGQPSFTRSMSQPDGTNESNDPSESGVDIWNVTTAAGNLSGTGDGQINIALIPNGTSFTIYATELGGGGGADKEARQLAKLDIAEAKRQGKVVATDGTITGSIDPTKPYYRTNNQYDIAQLPTQYDGGDIVDNPNTGGFLQGRPWSPDTIITVIEEGLVLNLDARNLNSWSRAPGETTWYDLTSNNNDATVYGGIAYGEALGGALAFGGSDAEYAQCPPGVYFTSAGYTIQSWVYVISVPNWNRIIDFGSDAGSDNVLLSSTLGTNGMPALWVGPSGDTVQSTVELQANTGWHHVCATWTPTGTVGKVFIDGVLTGTGTVAAPVAGVRANCYIGKSNWGNPPDPNFNGGMGAIQIYSRALSDAEILSNYNTTKSYYGL